MKTLFITGAAGYVGAMLCDQFSKRPDVKEIVALDVEEQPELLKGNPKVYWIKANTAELSWQETARAKNPSIVIHTAWQIRELYGQRARQWHWNVRGSANVFDFALKTPSVKKLVYFSSAAIYGAEKTNTFDQLFVETDPIREEEYSYGKEKGVVEKVLRGMWEKSASRAHGTTQVFVVRPAAITGPRGRFMRVRFGLQSALSGQLRGDFVYKIISAMVSFVPATPWWVRQFIHEDDVCDIVARLTFNNTPGTYEVFNITPPGEPVYAAQMARTVGKRILPVFPWMVRLAYFVFWHITRGKVPTSKGIWRFYSYPIVMDGSKLVREFSYRYRHSSRDAFAHTEGRYESYVPLMLRKTKSKS
ncbi:MAG: NAD-dependent epimerase/dehydratase family protein [Parcubacteria group bacterium]|nr:NAD-dependent epimerase/dehydratase family protein [Parcubacteria group bacterium]